MVKAEEEEPESDSRETGTHEPEEKQKASDCRESTGEKAVTESCGSASRRNDHNDAESGEISRKTSLKL
jgi:hypothetical protein